MKKIAFALFLVGLPCYGAQAATGDVNFGAPVSPEEVLSETGEPNSVDPDQLNLLSKFPPHIGWPCQVSGGSNFCDDKDDNTPEAIVQSSAENGCPVRDDIKGEFGKIYSITQRTNTTLPCGGVVALGIMEFSTVPNPDRLVIADGGGNFTLYKRNFNPASNVPDFEVLQNVTLPTKLCAKNAAGDAEEALDMPPVMQQMILFTSGSQKLVLRTMQSPPAPPAAGVLTPEEADKIMADMNPAKAKYADEKFLVLPLKNGAVDFDPDECPLESDWFKARPSTVRDVSFAAVTSAEDCQDTSVTVKVGECSGNTMWMNLDKPALVHQPSRTASFMTIEGRPEMLTVSTDASFMMMQLGSQVRIGSTTGDYVLPEGGRIAFNDNKILHMKGPARIDPGSGRAYLQNGGHLETISPAGKTDIAPGQTVNILATPPYTVYPDKKLLLPTGMVLPTAASPTLRYPLDLSP